MAAANAVGGCWASPGRMAASGIAASMSSIAETCCPPANPAAPPCHAARMERPKFDVAAVPAIRRAPNAKMAGWSNAAAVMESSLAASAIRPASGKRKYRAVTGPQSRSRDAETGPDMRCAFVPIARHARDLTVGAVDLGGTVQHQPPGASPRSHADVLERRLRSVSVPLPERGRRSHSRARPRNAKCTMKKWPRSSSLIVLTRRNISHGPQTSIKKSPLAREGLGGTVHDNVVSASLPQVMVQAQLNR